MNFRRGHPHNRVHRKRPPGARGQRFKLIRAYDPQTGKELWRLGGSSKNTAPTPIFSEGMFVVASGRGPERPSSSCALRPGDLTLTEGKRRVTRSLE